MSGIANIQPYPCFFIRDDRGCNNFGQLRLGDEQNRDTPQEVTALSDEVILSVAVHNSTAFAVTQNGKVYAMGENRYGQLGIGNKTSQKTPIRIAGLPEPVREVVIYLNSVYAITTSGKVYAWGQNTLGQLGLGDNEDKTTPQLIAGLSDVQTLAVDDGSVIAVTVDDKNTYGALTTTVS